MQKVLRVVLSLVFGFALVFLIWGCDSLERKAYNTVVGAKAFLDDMKSKHPECVAGTASTSTICDSLRRATGAKDALIDAAEVYCSGPQFETGGVCQPPAKGTPALQQATAKLQAAISNYTTIESDVRKAVAGQ